MRVALALVFGFNAAQVVVAAHSNQPNWWTVINSGVACLVAGVVAHAWAVR